MAVTCEIVDYKSMMKDIENRKQAPKKAMQNLMSDAKKRAPGWIAQEVAKEYGVRKGEVNSGALGSMKVKGDGMESLEIIYKGRVLTPTHFGMTPKAPGKNAYTIKASILKGQKKALGGSVKRLTKKQRKAIGKNFRRQGTRDSSRSPVMLMRTGGTYIPVQRMSQDRKDIKAIKTLSLPQMVTGKASEGITNAINEGLEKRLEHHLNRYL